MAYFLCALRGLICTILLTHNTGVNSEAEDLTPIVVFVQQFVKPYISFVRRWVKPNNLTSFGNKSYYSPPFKLQTVLNNTVLTVLGMPPIKRTQEFQQKKPSWTQKKLLSFENRTLMPMPAILRMKTTSYEDIFKKTVLTNNNEWRDVSENDPFSEKEIASFINKKVKGYVDNEELDFRDNVSRETGSLTARNIVEKAMNIGRSHAIIDPQIYKNGSNPQRTYSEKQSIPKLAMRPMIDDKKMKPRVHEGGFHDVVFRNLDQLISPREPTKFVGEEIALPDINNPNIHNDDSQEIVFENGDIQLKRAWNDDENNMATNYESSTANACMYDGKSTRIEIDLGLKKNEQERADLYKAVCPYIYDDKSNAFKSVVSVVNRPTVNRPTVNRPTVSPIPTQNTEGLDLVSYINRHRGWTPKIEEMFQEVVDIED